MSRAKLKSLLGSWQEWGTIVFLLLTLSISVGSVEQAHWVTPELSLMLVLTLAVLTGWILCKSRLPVLIAHPLAILLGAAVTVWRASGIFASPDLASRISQLAAASQSWWQALNTSQPAEGSAHFVVFLVFLTWIMGYISTWFILRRRNAWVGICLGATALLVNLSNLPTQYFVFFLYYALAALFLVGMTNLAKQDDWFKDQNIPYPAKSAINSVASLLCLSSLVVSVAWLTPELRIERFETWIGGSLGRTMEKQFDNFFASIPAKQPILRSDEKNALFFGDSSFDQGDQLHFVIISDQPLYLRTRMYDNYTTSGWTSSNATEHTHRQGTLTPETSELAKLRQITYTVVPKVKTDILLNGGEFVSSSIPASVRTLPPLSFSTDPTQPTSGTDTVAITSLYSLKPDRHYRVTASISASAPEDLSRTDGEYPSWVTDYYLQLPAFFPERVRRLSEAVTRQAKTPYDKAIAIKDYLANIEYQLEATAPPARVDGIDYFLFTQKSGNCVQFASAMAVMLRSLGIPSRVLSGYAPGETDANTGNYVLTAKDSHAWPEVYFSGYGWVGFEATPGQNTEPGLTDGIEDTGAVSPSAQSSDELLEEDIGGGSLGISSAAATNATNLWGMYFMYIFGGIFTLVVIIWLFVTGRERHLAKPDYSSKIYRQMCFFASLVGMSPRPQQTPLEYGAKLASAFPLQAEAFGNIVQTYVESQYSADKKLGRWEGYRLQRSWREARRRLIRRRLHLR
ncbi:MAG: transglutaminase domain-containing protein [Chloroflexi bacterium]|nr:transglutaminase domain-containing protein [Chloroflexota bacterium]